MKKKTWNILVEFSPFVQSTVMGRMTKKACVANFKQSNPLREWCRLRYDIRIPTEFEFQDENYRD